MGTITTEPEGPSETTPYGNLGRMLALEYLSELCLSLVLMPLDGSVRARASQYRLSWDEPIRGHAACKMASTVTVLRRWRRLRLSAGTCWW